MNKILDIINISDGVSLVVVIVFVIILFSFVLGKFLFLYKKGEQSKSWLPVEGEVIYRKLRGAYTSDRCVPGKGGLPIRGLNWLNVHYAYNVKGEEYIGKRVSYQIQAFSSDNIDFALQCERYWPDEKVTVYYNPLNPKEAVLERKLGISKDIIIALITLVSFFAICYFLPKVLDLISIWSKSLEV